ncbi:autotransporter outer membrane beta-barrel domain-containing protein [Bradyrhizobium sp. 5.13L]
MSTSDLSRAVSGLSSRSFGPSPVRLFVMAAAAFAAMPLLSAPAQAACTPAAANNVAATCTGVTTDQNGTNGYGSAAIDNLAVTVVQGASVTGTSYGIRFNTGTVVNSGTITGINDRGVFGATSATVTNFGTISGFVGVDTGLDGSVANFGTISSSVSDGVRGHNVTVVNSGTITGLGFDGVFATGSSTVSNSGSIIGNLHGIYALGDISVINSGSISSANDAIYAANGSATVVNSGTIAMTDTFGSVIYAQTTLTLINSGIITSTSVGPSSGGTIDVTNSGSILNNGFGPAISGTVAKVTNSGTIIAVDGAVVSASNVTVTNSGLMRGYWEGVGSQYATVTNSGTIIGEHSAGVSASFDAIVTNSGAITGSGAGIRTFNGSVNTVNFGTITGKGPSGIGILSGTMGTVVNSGTIIGEGGTAIQFGATTPAQSDSLTVLPGARFGGVVDFTGGADTVSFGPGSWILNTANFDKTLSTVTTAGNPYVVTSNQIIVADLSSFGAQNRAIMDITGWIGSVLPDAPVFAPGAGAANAFAATEPASPFDAFDSFPSVALGYAPAPAFKAASTNYGGGNAVWAKAFGGQRLQDNNGALIGGTTTGYGGAVGYERLISPDLRLGVLAGGSTNKTNLHFNAGNTGTDTVFGGAYSRKTWGGTFLDLSVIGGSLDNSSLRNIGGGLAFATATASYGGWFVNPAMMFGRRLDVDGRGFTITPAVKVRYVAAHFGGYAETGAGAANVSVAGRDFQAWEERAELTFANTRMLANGHRVTARVSAGALAQQRSAGGLVNVVLLGQNFVAATPERSSVAGGYSSAGLDWQMGPVTLFAHGEATYTNDVSRTYAGKGGARVTW